MPPVVAAAAITAGAGLGAAALSSHGNSQANKTNARAAEQALEQEKLAAAEDKRRYDEQQAALKAQWEAKQAERAPYRQAALNLLRQQGGRLGLGDVGMAEAPAMPAGWNPNASPVPTSQARTLSSYAGLQTPEEAPVPLQAPKLTLADIMNGSWGAGRAS